jgi:hypothetical protein
MKRMGARGMRDRDARKPHTCVSPSLTNAMATILTLAASSASGDEILSFVLVPRGARQSTILVMGFNRREMVDDVCFVSGTAILRTRIRTPS